MPGRLPRPHVAPLDGNAQKGREQILKVRAHAFEFVIVQQHMAVRVKNLFRRQDGRQAGLKDRHKGLAAFSMGVTKPQGQNTAAFPAPVIMEQRASPLLKRLPGLHKAKGRKAPAQPLTEGQKRSARAVANQQGRRAMPESLPQNISRAHDAEGRIMLVHYFEIARGVFQIRIKKVFIHV